MPTFLATGFIFVARCVDTYSSAKFELFKGTADKLDFEDDYFDIVIVGIVWYWLHRNELMRSIAEVDRVLKEEGFLVLWDFDTKILYVRDNIHTPDYDTYKMDVSKIIEANPQYYLVQKSPCLFGAKDKVPYFTKNIQDRLAVYIFYKEKVAIR